ncbi:MAG: response regulator [Acidobacteria bacterium]|nr:response regulator [Acidobacteriota bacterium]MCB9398794.1 response regulator [Acidobacteriota bacterium]
MFSAQGLNPAEKKWIELAFEPAPVPVCITRLDVFLFVNPAFAELYGYSPQEIIQKTLWDLIAPASREVMAQRLARRALGEKALFKYELVGQKMDGSFFPFQVETVRIPLSKGDAAFSYITDLSGRRYGEQMVFQSQKLENLGILAGGIAHDFNNLMMAILGYCELTLDMISEPLIRENMLQIQACGERAVALTSQLLAFSRKQSFVPQPVRLDHLVDRMQDLISRLVGAGIELAAEHASPLGTIMVDPNQMEQVILNLAVNARDAMGGQGQLRFKTQNHVPGQAPIRVEEMNDIGCVSLSVRDSGVGMDADTISKIFEPFFTTKEMGKGTGLGLSTVLGIVKQNGGDIHVESTLGEGTTFQIFFPQCHAADSEKVSIADGPIVHEGKGWVLVVEDEASVRGLIRMVLRGHGYEVLEAVDGREALAIIKLRDDLKMVITDVVMPGMNGIALAEAIEPLCPQLRVLFMTGYNEGSGLTRFIGRPGFKILYKPFNSRQLLLALEQLLSDTPAIPAE